MDKKDSPYSKGPRKPDATPRGADRAGGTRWPTKARTEAGGRDKVNHNAYKPVERNENSVWPDPQKFLARARPPRPPAGAR